MQIAKNYLYNAIYQVFIMIVPLKAVVKMKTARHLKLSQPVNNNGLRTY
ncbi:hypothetical protein QC766_16965 (plasmid) [Lactiplantibacillus plantarum]|nr:hypothetical protein [Lactiplantibacillus plantarum]WGI47488.1 hypothetical protein QC766_16965 [Lactiplantibacillus plantarum]